MTNLTSIFRAGFVRRWHSNADLCHTVDRDDWPELLTWINETADVLGVDMKDIGI